jgi:polysaccharide pyruvyl transferase WcaK-like protein
MKILQFGLCYSSNVGDGIISECLVHGLRAARPEAEVMALDISGRQSAGQTVVGNRSAALKLLSALPKPLRGRLVEARLRPILDRAEPAWRAALDGADLAVLGGGQIFSDADLNFPAKISRVAGLLRQSGTPTAVFAAGVARNWSPRGAELFGRVFETDLRRVGLRDAGSIAAWEAQAGPRGPAPVLTRDPGLLAAACYGGADAAGRAIGLCVMDMSTARYHADALVAGGPQTYALLARELAARGHEVLLFCNGAAEDRAALAAALGAAGEAGGRIRGAPPPESPADLAALVRGCRAVVAHRLHACITAYAYARPIVGLGWDGKLEAFFRSVGAEAGFVGAADVTAAQLADHVEAALERGVDAQRHGAVVAEARAAVEELLELARPAAPTGSPGSAAAGSAAGR